MLWLLVFAVGGGLGWKWRWPIIVGLGSLPAQYVMLVGKYGAQYTNRALIDGGQVLRLFPILLFCLAGFVVGRAVRLVLKWIEHQYAKEAIKRTEAEGADHPPA